MIEALSGVGSYCKLVESSTGPMQRCIPMNLMALERGGPSSRSAFGIVVYSVACIGSLVDRLGGCDTVLELLMGISSRGACAPSTLFLLALSLLHAMLHRTLHDCSRDAACLS